MHYYTYILQSEKDNSFYIGHTEDMAQRILYHNMGLSKYTRGKMPWKVVYYEIFATRSEAMQREYFLKKQKNKAFYQRLIEGFKL